jgi:Transmembrane Fragile-X-F protein
MSGKAHPIWGVFAAASLAAIFAALPWRAEPAGQGKSNIVFFSDEGKKQRGSSAVPGTTGRPAEILRARGSIRVTGSQQFQAKGFYMSGCVSLVLAALKLTEMKSWSWWRVFLPFWVIVGQNVIYVLVGFPCLFAVRYGEDEEAEELAKVQSDRIVYQIASLVCVLISTDNLLRWLERGGNSYWFWLCSGSVAMVVLFGILALVAQFVYWAELGVLTTSNTKGSGHGTIMVGELGPRRVF